MNLDDLDVEGNPVPPHAPPLQFQGMPDIQTPEGYYPYQQWLGNQVPHMTAQDFGAPQMSQQHGFQAQMPMNGPMMKGAGAVFAKASQNASAVAKKKPPKSKVSMKGKIES